MKQKVILIVSVLIGLFAAFLTRAYLTAKDNEVAQKKLELEGRHKKISVLVAKEAMPSGTVLTTENMGSLGMPENIIGDHAIPADDYLLIRNRKIIREKKSGSPIFWTDIEGGDPGSRGLASDIKTRMRAISINVSGAAAVSGMVKPNDHVDVLGTFSFPSQTAPGEMELVTLTMLQDVLVLATGRETGKSRLYSDSRSSSGSYNTVTLEVTPREAEMLVFAEQIKGRIALALRNPDDVYFEKTLPRVDFKMIQSEIENLNTFRQLQYLKKRAD